MEEVHSVKTLLAILMLLLLPLVATACGPAADRPDTARESSVATRSDSAAHAPATGDHASGAVGDAHTGHSAAGDSGQALLPIMQRLSSEMNALTYALMTDDYQTVSRSAAAIAEHAPISAAELERIRSTLGGDMARFEAVDESVHVASVRLNEAARGRQLGLVVDRLGEVQRGCVSCHAQFREKLRTNRAGR